MVYFEALKSAIEGLPTPTKLNDHPLADAQFVTNYLRRHPEKQNLPKGKCLGWALADFWRTHHTPSRIAPEDWNEWRTFLCLEVGYFHPFRHNARFPGNAAQIGRALSDKDHVAQVIADNDQAHANELMQKKYDGFWSKILPKEERATPYSTVKSRLEQAIKLLLQEIQAESVGTDREQSEPVLQVDEQPLLSETGVTPPSSASLQSATQDVESLSTKPYALAAYQTMLDRQPTALVGYRPPVCRYESMGQSQEFKAPTDAQMFLEKHQTLVVIGDTGIGKTIYLTQVLVPTVRQLGLVPVFVPLAAYFDARERVGDLSGFVREKIFGQWHPDAADKEAFARELAQAIRERHVLWLLDGYDELTPRERGLLNQELERLDRFVLTTRRIKPEARRPIEATLQLTHIDRNEALEYVSTRYSANARLRIEEWCERHYEAQFMLESGWWLDETAQLAHDLSQALSLTTVLERAISRQLSTRARFQSATSTDIYALTRNALSSLAFESLSPKWLSGDSPDRLSRSQLVFAWRSRSTEPEAIFFEVIGSTGLLVEEGKEWRFPNEFVRDEFAAEFIQSEGFTPSGRAFYPQYERPISFWAAKLMRSGQPQRTIDLLTGLLDLSDDPYGARWSMIVRILGECLPFEIDRMRSIRLEAKQALLDRWQTTASNRMRWQINFWLYAIGSDQIPDMASGLLENALRDLETSQPKLALSELMQQAGHAELARRLADGGRVDQQAVTHTLIDIVADGPAGLVTDAAIYLTQRNLEPTTLEGLRNNGPIDRLVDLAKMSPANSYVSAEELNRGRAAQSAALGILGRPVILTNESLLKRIPADVIHSLMADLHLRIRKTDNQITVITADGREWKA